MRKRIVSTVKYATSVCLQRMKYRYGKPLPAPTTVGVTFTNLCNLSCPMCIWKAADTTVLSAESLRNLFEDLAVMGVRGITNYGGEPLLRKDLPQILQEVKSLGLRVSITTNAALIPRIDAFAVLKHVDHLNISIDSPIAEQYDRSRGKEGAFEDLQRALLELNKIRASFRKPIEIKIHSMVTPETIHDPTLMVALCNKFDVPFVTYAFPADPSFKYLGDGSYLSKLREWSGMQENYRNFRSMILKILELTNEHNRSKGTKPLFAINPFYVKGSLRYFKNRNPIGSRSCYVVNPVISSDGTVSMCCAGETAIGNIYEMPFSQIWNSNHAFLLRKKIAKGMCGEHCYHVVRHLETVRLGALLRNPLFAFSSLRY